MNTATPLCVRHRSRETCRSRGTGPAPLFEAGKHLGRRTIGADLRRTGLLSMARSRPFPHPHAALGRDSGLRGLANRVFSAAEFGFAARLQPLGACGRGSWRPLPLHTIGRRTADLPVRAAAAVIEREESKGGRAGKPRGCIAKVTRHRSPRGNGGAKVTKAEPPALSLPAMELAKGR